MAYEFSIRRRVEFAETDMAGIMHFSNFFRFMEVAEATFYRSLGFSVIMKETGVGWPRVHAECDYAKPLYFEEEVEVRMIVQETRSRSACYLFKFVKLENQQPVIAARGKVVVVCASKAPDGSLAAVPLPEFYTKHIQPAPPAILANW